MNICMQIYRDDSHSNRKMLHDSLGSGRCLELFFLSFCHPGCLFRGLLWVCADLSPIPVQQVLDATFCGNNLPTVQLNKIHV